MAISNVTETTGSPFAFFSPVIAGRTGSSLPERQSAASNVHVVREPDGRYVGLVNGAAVTGSSVQSVENSVTNLVNIFA